MQTGRSEVVVLVVGRKNSFVILIQKILLLLHFLS
jgi:hypothetical protein